MQNELALTGSFSLFHVAAGCSETADLKCPKSANIVSQRKSNRATSSFAIFSAFCADLKTRPFIPPVQDRMHVRSRFCCEEYILLHFGVSDPEVYCSPRVIHHFADCMWRPPDPLHLGANDLYQQPKN